VADTLGFAVLLLAQQRIPLDSTHAELGAMWAALKKLRWAVEQGLLGWGRHKVKLLCDCDTIAKTLSPEGGRIDPRFWPLLSGEMAHTFNAQSLRGCWLTLITRAAFPNCLQQSGQSHLLGFVECGSAGHHCCT
jgi:hypothetical protein